MVLVGVQLFMLHVLVEEKMNAPIKCLPKGVFGQQHKKEEEEK